MIGMVQLQVCDAYRRHYANKCKARQIFSVYEWLQVGRLERSQVKKGDRRMSESGTSVRSYSKSLWNLNETLGILMSV